MRRSLVLRLRSIQGFTPARRLSAISSKDSKTSKIALITGSNDGIGFSTAKKLAEEGWDLVLTTRSVRAGEKTREAIRSIAPASNLFVLSDMELTDAQRVRTSLSDLPSYLKLDCVLMNAGGIAPKELKDSLTPEGATPMYAMNTLGHHVLLMELLKRRNIAEDGIVLFSSSEAARGVKRFVFPIELEEIRRKWPELGRTRKEVIESVIRGRHYREGFMSYVEMTEYSFANMMGTCLITFLQSELEKCGSRIRLFSVSPGATKGTSAVKKTNWVFRSLGQPLLNILGVYQPVEGGRDRYLQVIRDPDRFHPGGFYATAKPSQIAEFPVLTGPLALQTEYRPEFSDLGLGKELFEIHCEMTGKRDSKSELENASMSR